MFCVVQEAQALQVVSLIVPSSDVIALLTFTVSTGGY